MVRLQNALVINKVTFYLNMQIAGELSVYYKVWIPHNQQLIITIKKKKTGEKQPNHLTKPRAHVTPSLQMTTELTKWARCCFWKDFIYNTRTAWQPITTHVWPKGVHHGGNGQTMGGNRGEALILTKEGGFAVVCCVGWLFFFFNLKITFVLPGDTGTDGASIIRCYNGLICLQCCVRVQIHVQMYRVFDVVVQDWVKCGEDECLHGV